MGEDCRFCRAYEEEERQYDERIPGEVHNAPEQRETRCGDRKLGMTSLICLARETLAPIGISTYGSSE